MKINAEVLFTLTSNPDPSMDPSFNGAIRCSLDCTEAEHALAVATFQKISDNWLPLKQEIVKSVLCTASFRDMISLVWEFAGKQLITFLKS